MRLSVPGDNTDVNANRGRSLIQPSVYKYKTIKVTEGLMDTRTELGLCRKLSKPPQAGYTPPVLMYDLPLDGSSPHQCPSAHPRKGELSKQYQAVKGRR